MKKVFAILCAALMTASFAGCGGDSKSAEKRESVVSGAVSKVNNVADDVGDGVTAAVSAAGSEIDRMLDNGQVSDGDGIIGNENNDDNTTGEGDEATTYDTAPSTIPPETTE